MFKRLRAFYKNNRIYCILMIISLFCVFLMGIGVVVYFVNQATSSKYGHRLESIEDVPITEEMKVMKEYLESLEEVTNVNVRLQGKIIYVEYEILETKTNEDIQGISATSLEKFKEEQLTTYDFQFIVARNNLEPYVGAKSKNNSIISWANYVYNTEEATTTKN